jgi:hypothetical protein
METDASALRAETGRRILPVHGWIGLLLAGVAWCLNWTLAGPRTHWAFFPLWLGYCLAVDGVVRWRTGTSLFTRSPRLYAGLFLASAPIWWLFELVNLRTQNWIYIGTETLSRVPHVFWTTLDFSTVIPAVFGSAELMASFGFLKRLPAGPCIKPNRRTTTAFFAAGWISLALMLAWPRVFFPFVWLSLYFLVEPLNVWLGNRSLAEWTRRGDWRPILALWFGVLLTAFFWEMWNYLSYPKWIYSIPWADWLHVFEMPLLGYGGYLPFALELFALYHLGLGLLGRPRLDYVRISAE